MVKKAKKLLALSLSIAMLLSCMAISVGATVDQYFFIDGAASYSGDTISLPVKMNDVKLLKGIQGTVNYDTTALSLTSITAPGTDAFDQAWTTNINDVTGTANFIGARAAAFLADDATKPVVMTLNFAVKVGTVAGPYVVSFSNTKAVKENGVYEDLGTSPSFTVNYTTEVAPDVTANDKKNQIVGFDSLTMEYAVSTDNFATWTSTAPAMSIGDITVLTGDKTVKVRFIGKTLETVLTFTPDFGDVDGNGTVDITDVGLALNIVVNMKTGITPPMEARAEVDGNGSVDIADVGKILNRVVNIFEPWASQQ